MEDLKKLEYHLNSISKSIVKDLVKAQRETAEAICKNAQSLAPGNGTYSSSIKVGDTEITKKKITTKIITDVTVTAKSTGNTYNLGFLLETGTEMHAIPNAFGWGDIFGHDSPQYKMTLRKDWHPGFNSMPHFIPALNKNKGAYENKIEAVLDKEFK
jgi:hypothetical protein